jgi:replicative DNA helicase
MVQAVTPKSEERIPPQNIEAEQSVLGSLMLDKDAVMKVVDFLTVKDFYKGTHQAVYKTMINLFERREPIDILSVTTKLRETKSLEEAGGQAYLAELVNSVPTASNIAHYAKIVQRKRILRELIGASYDIAQLGYKEEEDIDVLLDEAERRIFGISETSLTQNFVQVKSSLEEAFERIDKLHRQEGGTRGVPTGFADLDNYLAGLQKSDLIVLAARPGLGKTSFALDIARNVAISAKVPVGLFSLEMSQEQLIDRLIASQADVDLWRIRTGNLSSTGEDNDFLRIQNALGTLSEAPIFIDDAPSPTIIQMRAMARRLQAEHGLGLIVVDYLQLIQPRTMSDNVVQQITEISRALKGLARELHVPVLALSQLSRAVEQRSPQIPRLSDLRDSGSIEQDSDVVLFIYRDVRDNEDSAKRNQAEIHIAKHRNGPLGKVPLYFDEKRVSFRDMAKNYE